MSKKPVVNIFKCKLDSNPFITIENKPDGALMIWGLNASSGHYDFQNYLNYIREAVKMAKSI